MVRAQNGQELQFSKKTNATDPSSRLSLSRLAATIQTFGKLSTRSISLQAGRAYGKRLSEKQWVEER